MSFLGLLNAGLDPDPNQRLSIDYFYQHPFLKETLIEEDYLFTEEKIEAILGNNFVKAEKAKICLPYIPYTDKP